MFYQPLVERVLTPVGKSGDDVIYLCPRCNDKSGHLYVNYNKGKYNCVRCGQFHGKSIYKLLQELGVQADFDYESLDGEYDKRLDEVLQLADKRPEVQIVPYSTDIEALNVYYSYHTRPLTPLATSYLLGRGLPLEIINYYQFREGVNHYGETFTIKGKEYKGRDYSSRIMIPSLQKSGRISFYLARDYSGMKSAKYVNVPQELAYSSEDVWNLDITDTDDVVICEGVMTAIAVNQACHNQIAVATYGKSIASRSNGGSELTKSTSQGEKLLAKRFKTYYVFYDYDAIDSAVMTANYLYDHNVNVKIVRIPDELAKLYGNKTDANDMTKEQILHCLRNAEPYDRLYGLHWGSLEK